MRSIIKFFIEISSLVLLEGNKVGWVFGGWTGHVVLGWMTTFELIPSSDTSSYDLGFISEDAPSIRTTSERQTMSLMIEQDQGRLNKNHKF